MPILGIIASSFRSAAGPQGAYDALATVTVPSGGVSSIEFVGIPSGYKHLQIRMFHATVPNIDNVYLQFNGDTGSNYSWHEVYGSGSGSGSATAGVSATSIRTLLTYDAPASAVIDVLDYGSVSKNKTIRTLTGVDDNGGGYVIFRSGLWMNSSSPITSLKFTKQTYNFSEYSQIALYGVK
jgi:hypothetical protein